MIKRAFQSSCEARGLRNFFIAVMTLFLFFVSILLRGARVAQQISAEEEGDLYEFQSSCEARGLRNEGVPVRNMHTAL